MYNSIKHYIVYHNEIRFVNPMDYPDGKVRIPLPPKCGFRSVADAQQDEIAYQDCFGKMRFAVRRIRHIGFGLEVGGLINATGIIKKKEGIILREKLHGAEKEMKDADAIVAKAIKARQKFKEDLQNGVYDDGRIRTEMAIKKDRETQQKLDAARNRAIEAAKNLYWMLVEFGTITEDEAFRRVGAVSSWGAFE